MYTLGMTKIPKLKYSMCVLASLEILIYVLKNDGNFTEKLPSLSDRWLKFSIKKSEIELCFRVIQIQKMRLGKNFLKIGLFFYEFGYLFYEKRILVQ